MIPVDMCHTIHAYNGLDIVTFLYISVSMLTQTLTP